MRQDSSVRIRGNPWPTKSAFHPAAAFAGIFVAIFLLHAPLLKLPYYWDEAGYYVSAARDLFLTGSLIPHTSVSNAHPPLVMAWIALWWKVAGFAPLVTRSAMIVVAAFSLLGLFRLAERAANTEVAIAATLCTAVYPVFFAQSSLAQVDLAAAGLTFWGLCAYLEDRRTATAVWFSIAALAKETAILAPGALAAWELIQWLIPKARTLGIAADAADSDTAARRSAPRRILALASPLLPLALWYAYHYSRTGYVFGNPEYVRYNITATLSPVRFALALLLRLWQTFGYMHLWLLTVGMLLAMLLPQVKDDGVERDRIAIPVQMIFFVVIAAYVLAMSLIGGAVLARYMLPAVPLVIILGVSTLYRRLRHWTFAVAVIAAAFVLAWFWNPPYGFAPEDNLAYRDFIVLHEQAEQFAEARYPMAHVLTAWPASNELTSPWLGYVTRPMQVVQIEDFSLEQVLSAAEFREHSSSPFEVALVFSTKYDPPPPWFVRSTVLRWSPSLWHHWQDLKRRFFGYHHDLPPEAAARILGGKIVFHDERKGQWIAVIELEQPEVREARSGGSCSLDPRL
jgi:Dolichyl-phosphate-mannose-protein mannosyltransferase